jgi:integrase
MKRRRKGSGTIEYRNGVHVGRLPDKDRTVLVRHVDRAYVERVLDAAVYELAAGNVTTSTTLATYGRTVLDRRERAGKRTVDDERSRWRAYIEPWECGTWPVAALKKRHIAKWLRDLRAKGLARQTRSNALNLLRAVLRDAVDDELVESNAAAEVRVPREPTTEETSTYLSLDEVAALFWTAPGDVERTMLSVAVGIGIRQGELRSLRVADVVASGQRPRVVVRYGSPSSATKSGKPRTLPLFGLALAALEAWRAPANDRGLVFPTVTGEPRWKGRVVQPAVWAAWLRRAGIARRVRWHDLRHTCATLLLDGAWGRQWSKEEVQALLGHSSITVTERYARTTDELLGRAAGVSHGYATRATDTAEDPATIAAEILEKNRSRLRDLNSRPTVYEGATKESEVVRMHDRRGLAEAYLRAVAGGSPFAYRLGIELAAAELEEGRGLERRTPKAAGAKVESPRERVARRGY